MCVLGIKLTAKQIKLSLKLIDRHNANAAIEKQEEGSEQKDLERNKNPEKLEFHILKNRYCSYIMIKYQSNIQVY